jgi:hypothetical protein
LTWTIVNAGLDCLLEIFVACARAAVKGHEYPGGRLDFSNSLDIQAFFSRGLTPSKYPTDRLESAGKERQA